MKKKVRWAAVAILVAIMVSSCDKWDSSLGQDVLPASDRVFVFHDTIFEISATTVTGARVVTSDHSALTGDDAPTYYIGELRDSVTGLTKASAFTQYNLTSGFYPAENTEIDSILLYLDIASYSHDNETPITISVYEATERFYMDTVYYSNMDPEGKYEPLPLANYNFVPSDADTVKILLNNGPGSMDYINKWVQASADTNYFSSDSVFRDHFNGFYITASVPGEESMLAEVDLTSNISYLRLRFRNDSTEVDSTSGRDFAWASFSINQFYTQKINVFSHDYSGTPLENIIDSEDPGQSFCYVQGLGGVNTRLSFDNLAEWMAKSPLSISSAKLILDIPGEELSGIPVEELAPALFLLSEMEDGSYQYTYDYMAYSNSLTGASRGGGLEREATSMFADTTYRYVFNLGLQFQSMVDGSSLVNDFRVQVNNPRVNYQFSKLWSNLATNPRRIRLEVVYLKL